MAVLMANVKMKKIDTKMMHTERLLMIGEMSAGIIHDINNPLSIAVASLELSKMNLDDMLDGDISEDKIKVIKKYLNNMESSLSRISKISESVRILSYGDESEFECVNLSHLLSDVGIFCQSFLNKNEVDLNTDISSDYIIKGNQTMLTQLFVNLIKNASDAISDLDCFNKWVNISCVDHKDCLELKIVDGGMGIPEAIRSKIFDPFFTTKKLGVGTGLGLGLCRQIVEYHAGTIEVEVNSKNTTFIIKLPKSNE